MKQGEFVLISGPSSCGKSTLVLCLAGLIPQAVPANLTGRVQVLGLDTRTHPVPALAQHVGVVFQNSATQLFNATVEEEVALAHVLVSHAGSLYFQEANRSSSLALLCAN